MLTFQPKFTRYTYKKERNLRPKTLKTPKTPLNIGRFRIFQILGLFWGGF
jgi:hypothetical protein